MCPNDIKRAKIDNGTFYAINMAEHITHKTNMLKENNVNTEEQLQEENVVSQAEETLQTAEEQDSTNKEESTESAETPEVEIDPLEAAQAEIAELKKQILYKVAEFDN